MNCRTYLWIGLVLKQNRTAGGKLFKASLRLHMSGSRMQNEIGRMQAVDVEALQRDAIAVPEINPGVMIIIHGL